VDPSVGTFSLTESTGTFVGVRVDEELSSIGATTAVMRTPDVTGTVELDGTTLVAASFEADFTTLVSDESRRDGAVQRALETDTYPTATFVLTEPVELDALPQPDSPVSTTAVGELTVHGVTNTVEVPLDVAIADGVTVVTGSFDITLSDYGVTAPTAPIVLSVADTGTVELQLYLTPA
jgi:polyisoprenoid-binding protein YceI